MQRIKTSSKEEKKERGNQDVGRIRKDILSRIVRNKKPEKEIEENHVKMGSKITNHNRNRLYSKNKTNKTKRNVKKCTTNDLRSSNYHN